MTGDGGTDVFIFKVGYGHDVVMDFTSGDDVIDLKGTDITSWDDFRLNHLSDDDASGNALITYGTNDEDSVLLFKVSSDTLTADDFLFAAA